jgi:hypothetical protein
MIKKPVIIHGFARSGTSWIQQHVIKYNVQNFNTRVIRSAGRDKSNEIFDTNITKFVCYEKHYSNIVKKIKLSTTDDKINFLEDERKKGIEYTYKPKSDHIYEIQDWFKDFYKDWEIIKVVRNNKWEQFISWAIQSENDWNMKHLYQNRKKINEYNLDWFLSVLRLDVNVFDKLWIYEDIDGNEEFLKDYFNVDVQPRYNHIKRRNNYPNNIKNYKEIKELFDKKYKQFLLENMPTDIK